MAFGPSGRPGAIHGLNYNLCCSIYSMRCNFVPFLSRVLVIFLSIFDPVLIFIADETTARLQYDCQNIDAFWQNLVNEFLESCIKSRVCWLDGGGCSSSAVYQSTLPNTWFLCPIDKLDKIQRPLQDRTHVWILSDDKAARKSINMELVLHWDHSFSCLA